MSTENETSRRFRSREWGDALANRFQRKHSIQEVANRNVTKWNAPFCWLGMSLVCSSFKTPTYTTVHQSQSVPQRPSRKHISMDTAHSRQCLWQIQSPYAAAALPDSNITSVYVSGQMDSGFVNKHSFGYRDFVCCTNFWREIS
jgi:hypothetical protein